MQIESLDLTNKGENTTYHKHPPQTWDQLRPRCLTIWYYRKLMPKPELVSSLRFQIWDFCSILCRMLSWGMCFLLIETCANEKDAGLGSLLLFSGFLQLTKKNGSCTRQTKVASILVFFIYVFSSLWKKQKWGCIDKQTIPSQTNSMGLHWYLIEYLGGNYR